MKKIFFVAMIFLFFPVSNALAADEYLNGWFDANPNSFTISDEKAVDNDVTTSVNVSDSKPLTITFNQGITLNLLSFYTSGSNYTHAYNFYDSKGTLLDTITISASSNHNFTQYITVNLKDVKKITVTRNSSNITMIREIEIFTSEPKVSVSDLKAKATHSSVTLSWLNPLNQSDFKGVIIKKDGVVIENLVGDITQKNVFPLEMDKEHKFEVAAVYEDGTIADYEEINVKTLAPPIVTDLTAKISSTTAVLNWKNPKVSDNTGIKIYKGQSLVASLSRNADSYKIISLEPETNYSYQVAVVYDKVESERVNVDFTTGKESLEIIDLTAKATHERVDLKWTLPDSTNFKHVNIYRDTVTEVSFLEKLIGAQVVQAAGTKIFETNGTYFNDLTVSPSTTYEYTLTSTSLKGTETPGITTTVTTSKLPPPVVGGGGYEEGENGDYTYYWTSPTTGKVKVMVGGKLYKTVEASDLKITIPKASMKYTIFGAPDVYLVAVSEDGTEGTPSKPPSSGGIGGGDMPFTPNDLLKAGNGLLWLIGPILLLALSFLLVPKLRNLIVKPFIRKKEIVKTTERRFNS